MNSLDVNLKESAWGISARLLLEIGFVLGFALLSSTSAYGDTYNFYFSKQKKKDAEAREVSEQESEAEVEEPPSSSPSPQAQAPVESNPTANAKSGSPAPIVINNYNTVQAPESTPPALANPPPAPTPSSAPEGSLVPSYMGVHSSTSPVPDYMGPRTALSPWRLQLTLAGTPGIRFGSSGYSTTSEWPYYTYETHLDNLILSGMTGSLGYKVSRVLTLNGALGIFADASGNKSNQLVISFFEMEFHPFATDEPWDWDTLELAGVLGAGTAVMGTNADLYGYGGVRAAINFNKKWGLVGTSRLNPGWVMVDVGVKIRI